MQTPDPVVAEEWFDTMAAAGVEGLVVKPANSPYLPGARVWMKYKSRQTTDAVIGGVTGSLHRPAALLLGRYASDTGRLHHAGRHNTPHRRSGHSDRAAPGAGIGSRERQRLRSLFDALGRQQRGVADVASPRAWSAEVRAGHLEVRAGEPAVCAGREQTPVAFDRDSRARCSAISLSASLDWA